MRFGAAVTAVVLASAIATVPAAVRIAPSLRGSAGSLSLWISLLAVAFFPLAVATVVLRHALAALRLFDPRAVATGIATVLVWGLVTFFGLCVFGALLRATTHQHALAGVTFAGGGIVLAAVLALFAARAVPLVQKSAPPLRWSMIAATAVAAGFGLAFLARVLARSDGAGALPVDIVTFAFAAAFGAGAFPHRSRPIAVLAFAGPPLAAAVLVIGFATLRTSPPLCVALDAEAPVLSAITLDVVCGAPGPKPSEKAPH
jgi:hypothetical protein